MGKIFIIIFLFIFLASFVIAQDCRGMKKDLNLKINVGIYDKIPNGENFTFEKSRFQPNDKNQVVKQGNVLLIESFSVSVNSSYCYNSGDKIKVFIYSPEDYPKTTSTLFEIPIDFENASFMYFFNAIQPITTKENNKYRYLIFSKNESIEDLNYISLDKIGEWDMQVRLVNENESIKENFNNIIFNNDSPIRFINVLDRLDVAQLETLEQLKEDSKKSSNGALIVSWIAIIIAIFIGGASIYFMYFFHKREEKRIIKTEEEKQIDLLRTLLTELIFLEENFKAYKETFSRQNVYPLYELWNIDTSLYFRGLNHKIRNHETIELKENLIVIKDKLLMINNLKAETKKLEEERGTEKLIKEILEINRKQIIKIIDADILPVLKKSKKFIKENFDIKSE